MQPLKRPWRLYLDTSVFGGCFDAAEGWDVASRRVVEYCMDGFAFLLTSAEVEAELAAAPPHVRLLFQSIPVQNRIDLPITDEVNRLADAYLAAQVVGPRWREDCLHMAAATISRADAIVSWNFKHIVRLDRIRGFNAVNLAQGYANITILSPQEVNLDE